MQKNKERKITKQRAGRRKRQLAGENEVGCQYRPAGKPRQIKLIPGTHLLARAKSLEAVEGAQKGSGLDQQKHRPTQKA